MTFVTCLLSRIWSSLPTKCAAWPMRSWRGRSSMSPRSERSPCSATSMPASSAGRYGSRRQRRVARSSRCSTSCSTTTSRVLQRAGPGYLAFIPGGGSSPRRWPTSSPTRRTASPGSGDRTRTGAAGGQRARLAARLDGIPRDHARALHAGGSMATFNALLCARERHLGADIRRGVIYTSDQAHHSVLKAAKIAGVMPDRVRGCRATSAIACRWQRWRRPLPPIAGRVCFRLRWCRAPARRTPARSIRCRPSPTCVPPRGSGITWTAPMAPSSICATRASGPRAGSDRADSLTLDPHKGMFLPYGTGALLVRDGAALRAAHEATATTCRPCRIPTTSTIRASTARTCHGVSLGSACG